MPLYSGTINDELSVLWQGNKTIHAVYRGIDQIWPSGADLELSYASTGTSTRLTVPLAFSTGQSYRIEWGDGTTTSGVGPNSGSILKSLSGKRSGTIKVFVKGPVKWKWFESNPASPDAFKSHLTSVDRCTLDFTGQTDFSNAFGSCTGLTSICADFLKSAADATKLDGFFEECTKLAVVPADFFLPCLRGASFKNTFSNCTALESLPANLFPGEIEATFDGTFRGCANLKSIDPDLFAQAHPASQLSYVFQYCTLLQSVPATLLARFMQSKKMTGCFYASGLKSIPAGLLQSNIALEDISGMFGSCASLTSYPVGLFSKCVKLKRINNLFKSSGLISTQENSFYSCPDLEDVTGAFSESKIRSVDHALFGNCTRLQKAERCFANCDNLTSLGGEVFRGCSNLQNVDHLCYQSRSLSSLGGTLFTASGSNVLNSFDSSFYYCEKLASIPDGLLALPSITRLVNTFAYSGIRSAPESLLAQSPAVTELRYLFQGCPVTSISTHLFRYNPSLTIAHGVFSGTQLTGSAPLMFQWSAKLEDAGRFFSGTGISSIPASLFANCPKLKSVDYAFYGTKLQSAIPDNLFENNPDLESAKGTFNSSNYYGPEHMYFPLCFRNKSKLKTLESCFAECKFSILQENVFSGCTSLESLKNCFYRIPIQQVRMNALAGCQNVTDASGIFEANTYVHNRWFSDTGIFDHMTKLANLDRAYYNCSSLGSGVPPLWVTHPSASHSQTFYNCTEAKNYSSIPSDWR